MNRSIVLHVLMAMSAKIICAADFTPTNQPASAPATLLTLEQAKSMALREQPSLEAMRQRVTAASATVRMARSAYWPSLNADASASRIQKHSYTGVPPAFAQQIDMTPYSTYGVDLTAGWVLFDGFRSDFDLLAAEQNEKVRMPPGGRKSRLWHRAVWHVIAICNSKLIRIKT